MPKSGWKRVLTLAFAGLLVVATSAPADEDGSIFIIRSTDKSPDDVVEAVKAYSDAMEWRYIGHSKVKQGQVRLVKICIPEVGRAVWPAGLELSALLPCGNIGVYETDAATEVSVLHPRYMHVLYPDPATEEASEIALPLLLGMLETVVQ